MSACAVFVSLGLVSFESIVDLEDFLAKADAVFSIIVAVVALYFSMQR